MTATSTASPCQSAIYLLDGSLFAHLPDYQPPEYADARIDMIVQYHGLSELVLAYAGTSSASIPLDRREGQTL